MTDRESRPTILAIDDTPDNLSVVSAVLKDDYRVKVAINGNEGLRIAMSDDPPDLILLDVMMPDLDGHEVCRRLKATERCRDIPVIFLTAMSESEDEEFGLSLGPSITLPSRSARRSCTRASKPIFGSRRPTISSRIKTGSWRSRWRSGRASWPPFRT